MHLKSVTAPWIILTILSAPSLLLAMQNEGRGDLAKQFRQNQTQKVVDELQRIANTIGKQDAWTKEIISSLDSEIDGAVERFLAERSTTDGRSPGHHWDPELRTRLWERARLSVPDTQIQFLNRLRKDTVLLDERYDQVSQEAATSFLDSYLCFSTEQEAHVSSILSEIWDPRWNEHAGGMAANGFPFLEEIVFEIDSEKLKQVLSPEQQAAFSDINKLSTGRARILMFQQGNADYGTLSMKDACERLMNLKIAEYDRLCELNDRQRKFLTVAKKGAVVRVVTSWDALVEELKTDPEVMRTIGRDFEALRALAEPALQQCVNRPEWRKTLTKILDENQMAKVVARDEQRLKACQKQLASYVIFANFGKRTRLLFTCEQFENLLELLESHIELEFSGDLISAMKGIHQIPNAKFEAILNASQWETLKPIVDRERIHFEKMLEAQESGDGD